MWTKDCVYYHTQVLLCNRLIFKAVLMSDNSNLRTLSTRNKKPLYLAAADVRHYAG